MLFTMFTIICTSIVVVYILGLVYPTDLGERILHSLDQTGVSVFGGGGVPARTSSSASLSMELIRWVGQRCVYEADQVGGAGVYLWS